MLTSEINIPWSWTVYKWNYLVSFPFFVSSLVQHKSPEIPFVLLCCCCVEAVGFCFLLVLLPSSIRFYEYITIYIPECDPFSTLFFKSFLAPCFSTCMLESNWKCPQKSCSIYFAWNFIVSMNQFVKNWHLYSFESSNLRTWYIPKFKIKVKKLSSE